MKVAVIGSGGREHTLVWKLAQSPKVEELYVIPGSAAMGAYAPAPVLTPELQKEVEQKILNPVVQGLAQEGITYKGCLYAGLMMTAEGPKVVEFNCRFGDPETQAVLPLLDSDLADIMYACAKGKLEPSMEYRIEKDSMGEIKVPSDKLWGAQTQRSFENFRIGTEKIPLEMVGVFGYLKKAAAMVNEALGEIDADRANAIIAACDEVLRHKLDDNFPLSVWMTGSGTQFNMNVNEVVAHRAMQLLQSEGKEIKIHPNDHEYRG